MKRRALLSLAAALSACLSADEAEEAISVTQRSGIPPWHMWGNTQVFDVPRSTGGATAPLNPSPGQITRVSYLRPESWHWQFSAKLLGGPDTNAVGQHVTLSVHWDLIVGVGRSIIVIPDFDVFSFNWNDGDNFPVNRQIWSTETQAPAKTFVVGPPAPSSGPVDQIVAQDIQLNVRLFLQELSIPSANVQVELAAQFAPKTHIRPEWHKGGSFPGAEDGGAEQSSVAKQIERLNKAKPPGTTDPDELDPEEYEQRLRDLYREQVQQLDYRYAPGTRGGIVIHRPPKPLPPAVEKARKG